ncbi:MAG: SusD/RagB family nutrient-binding outer membrane lipoprotein, partial [Ferruginibacter sp.]
MKKYNYTISAIALIALLFVNGLSSCTKKFEEFNTNPFGVSDADLNPDGALIVASLQNAEKNIYVASPAWITQLQQNLMGDVYSGYMMPPTPFASNSNNMNYNLVDGWNTYAWNPAYTGVMLPLSKVEPLTKTAAPEIYAMSKIIKVEAMHRVSDIFGPIIYSKYRQVNADLSVDFDSQQAAYTAFFADLAEAIAILTPKVGLASSANFTKADLVYGGDYRKWVRFANTLRLRLALRIVKADAVKAKAEGEAALANSAGLLNGNADNFNITLGTSHPLNVMNNEWGDVRLGAPVESILGGYSDPRLPSYAVPAIDAAVAGQYKGIRQGINIDAKSRYADYSKLATFPDVAQMMTSAEAAFLKAEAALRGWAGAGSAQTNYEAGIQRSFDQYSLGSAIAYYGNATAKPKPYVDPKAITPGQNDVLATSPYLS